MRILVVGPQFHGYTASMARALEHRGHTVRAHEYDLLPGIRGAAVNKALHDLPSAWTPEGWKDTYGRHAAAELHRCRPDALVVVKGDILGDRWWDAVETWGGPVVVWFYDELRRMSYTPEQLTRLPAIATYSPDDAEALRAQGLEATHVPLAFDAHLEWTPRASPEVTFIGARYPQREARLRGLGASGVPVKAFGRDWSRHPVDVLNSRKWRASGLAWGRNLSRAEAYGVMCGSPATINSHGDQDGFTMRTFEVCGVGGVQLVDRADVDRHFDPGTEVLVYRDAEELTELARRAVTDRPWARRIAEAGQRRALAEHTFDHRMETLEQLWA